MSPKMMLKCPQKEKKKKEKKMEKRLGTRQFFPFDAN